MEELDIPVAYCPTCDDEGPVVIDVVELDGEITEGFGATVIYCPQCESLLNVNKSVKLTWYNAEDLERATGWRLS